MVLYHRSAAHLTMLGPQPLNLSNELPVQGLQTLHVLLLCMLTSRQAGQLALQGRHLQGQGSRDAADVAMAPVASVHCAAYRGQSDTCLAGPAAQSCWSQTAAVAHTTQQPLWTGRHAQHSQESNQAGAYNPTQAQASSPQPPREDAPGGQHWHDTMRTKQIHRALGRRSTCCSSFATSSGPPEAGVLEVSAAGEALGELPAGEAGAEAHEERCCLAAAMRCSRATLAAALSLASCAVRHGSAMLCKLAITRPHRQGLSQQHSQSCDLSIMKVFDGPRSMGHVSLPSPVSSKPQNVISIDRGAGQ